MLSLKRRGGNKSTGRVREENWTEWVFGRQKDLSLPHKWPYHPGGTNVCTTTHCYHVGLSEDGTDSLGKWVLLFLKEKNPTCNGCSAWFSDCILISDYLFLFDLKLFLFFFYHEVLLNPFRRRGGAFKYTRKGLWFESILRSGVNLEALDRAHNSHHL